MFNFSTDFASAPPVDVHIMWQFISWIGASVDVAPIERVSRKKLEERVDIAPMRDTETTIFCVNDLKTSGARCLLRSVSTQDKTDCNSNKFATREWKRFDGDFGNSVMFENGNVLTTEQSPGMARSM